MDINKRTKMTHCENCMYWSNGYCRLHKQETNDSASCDKAIGGILGFRCKYFFCDDENNSQNNDYFFKKERKNDK